MMRRCFIPLFATLFLSVALFGCSSAGVDDFGSTDDIPDIHNAADAGENAVLGYWQIIIDEAGGGVSILPQREAMGSLNVLGMLQKTKPSKLEINPNSIMVNAAEHEVALDVRIWHPIGASAGIFTAFDIRGIVFGPRVTNADGWTTHLNPMDFSGVPFGYGDGALGTPNSQAHFQGNRFGYKYFCYGLSPNEDLVDFFTSSTGLVNRGRFPEGGVARRHYVLDWDDTNVGLYVFNYAVLASFAFPESGGTAPYGLDDFDINRANCAEAFCMSATVTDNSAWFGSGEGGGEFDIEVEVWDWQGLESTEVSIRSAPVGTVDQQTVTTYVAGTTAYSGVYSFDDVPVEPVNADDIRLIVTATDRSRTFGEAWFGGLLPYSNWRYDDYVYTMPELTLEVEEVEEPPEIPDLLDESFEGENVWTQGPYNFWTVNFITPGAADNRNYGMCYGAPDGITLTWLMSPSMVATQGGYSLPFKMRIEHQIDVETYYDRCWAELKVGCDPWEKIYPYCGFLYNSTGWWDGYHEEDWSLFELPGINQGDIFWVRFVTHTLDGDCNCVGDGYDGWQIFEVLIYD